MPTNSRGVVTEVIEKAPPETKTAQGDNWADQSTFACSTCRFFVPKADEVGRCRRNAPTMDGYPVVYASDWCGSHKLGTNPSRG